jgi:predicted esterase
MKTIRYACLALAIIAASAVCSIAAPCGPFGDPPAEVSHTWFASFVTRHSPVCSGAKRLGPWRDAGGEERYACLYQPSTASKKNPLPLVVFLHGSVANADSVKFTGLTTVVDTAELGVKRPGFILLTPQGRYTSHFYPGIDGHGFGWDNWYRQLSPSGDQTFDGATYPENVDATTIDHFVAQVVARGGVDTGRIYLMGWSNGAAMAVLYALNRSWVAAAAVYSAPDPFSAFFDLCSQVPVVGDPNGVGQIRVFNPRVPIMHVRNDCDIGGICPNGTRFAERIRAMGGNIDDVILNSSENRVTSCDQSCGTDMMGDGQIEKTGEVRGLVHHVRWPKEWNERMLSFLAGHSITAPASTLPP